MITTGVTSKIPDIPPQATNSFRFSLFNAINFQITLGAPMVLYAKSLGGSATTIGLVASLAPLMTVLQLPTAYFIPRVGYKGFVLFGWSLRAVLLFMLAIMYVLVNCGFVTTKLSGNPFNRITLPRPFGGATGPVVGRPALPVNNVL